LAPKERLCHIETDSRVSDPLAILDVTGRLLD